MKEMFLDSYPVERLILLKQISGNRGGIIAMNYTMKGAIANDPQIIVNPLSVLAPGFLKKIGQRR